MFSSINELSPSPDKLQTGDLLFPRTPDSKIPLAPSFNADFLQFKSLNDESQILANVKERIWTVDGAGDGDTKQFFLLEKFYGDSLYDMPENKLLHEAFKVKDAISSFLPDFSNIFGFDANSTLDDFLKNPLVMLFRAGLGGPDNEFSLGNFDGHLGPYYIGHVAMAVRRDQQVFVIEANASDFSHYRVSLHPYDDAAELSQEIAWPTGAGIERLRSWRNQKLARGNYIWAARPKDAGQELSLEMKQMVEAQAKLMLGRPYDMFDTKTLGDDDRIYCSEFIFRAFKLGANIDVTDQATWQWVVDRLLDLSDMHGPSKALLSEVLTHALSLAGIQLSHPFPWMTPKMLYHSQVLDTSYHRPPNFPAGKAGSGNFPYA
ncbi:YiiX/YebB-like N1pC/P60 family cysteine hydrolase [Undibacterium sp. TC4M20W]|uniref:YiiX/YebB-like N1pC/P60 family cysteine hydrolase n=1 Tax=Undibacterium sp. TC4M20W TaxID=3413052 RepID=UPI003BF1AAD2